MTSDDLQLALQGLSTERLQRLVDGLAADPDVKLTIGAWRPHCPMVLAGFDPATAAANTPEHRFACVWDRFAKPDPWWRIPSLLGRPAARRAHAQLLLRIASAVLAARASSSPGCRRRSTSGRSHARGAR